MDERPPIRPANAVSGMHSRLSQPGCADVVTDLIAAQAVRTPNRVAIHWAGGAPWTYARLAAYVDAIAYALLDRGVTRGELIGIHVPRRPEMVAAALGAMRAGAAYVPLDPSYPPERLRFTLRHARVRQVLAWQQADRLDLQTTDARILALDGFEPGNATGVALPALSGDDLAYVLYTSGSTGTPKGVRILHRNLVNNLVSMGREPGITDDDVFGAFTTLAFDASVHEVFLPLLVGASMVMANATEQSDPAAATALMLKHPMTLLEITPTQLRLMLADGRIRRLRDIKLWVGGEELPRDLAEKVLPHCRELWNTYGPTETTVEAVIHRVTHGSGPVPLGKPIANTNLYVLDASCAPVADGDIGEIWIGGAGVADGYLDDPEKTAERFVSDPFAADGSRMYRTGDLGCWRNGLLYFHGRVDAQIQLNGIRVEPGEIEAVAMAEAGVRQAVAVAHDFGDGDIRLLLYVASATPTGLGTRLREALRHQLPTWMQPRHIEILDTLPRTPSGKIDRNALPLPRLLTADAPSNQAATDAVAAPAFIDAGRTRWSTLVSLQPHGTRPPLYVIHTFDGDLLDYRSLAQALGTEQPVFGIEAVGLDGCVPPIAALQTIAACHVAEIQREQPHGPYFVAGASMGALIACEIACQLQESGETVGLLAIFGNPNADAMCASSQQRRLPRAIDAWRVRHARATGQPLPSALRRREIQRAHRTALQTWQPRAYTGSAVLFMASNQHDDPATRNDTGWSRHLCGEVRVVEVAGDENEVLERPGLSHHLRDALAQAQAACTP